MTRAVGGDREKIARKVRAFCVHVLTASGAAFAFLALLAAIERQWALMFLWLGIALIVDAVDGPIARRLDVPAVLPRWSGATLDLIVDFLTYVFVPAFAIAASGLMPTPLGVASALAIVVTGALYFADGEMKTPDNFFRGFPGLWNLVAFYLLLLTPPAVIAAATVALFVVLTFAPLTFIHPIRVARFRPFNLALLALWAVLALAALWRSMMPGLWITFALCAIGLYFAVAGLLRRR